MLQEARPVRVVLLAESGLELLILWNLCNSDKQAKLWPDIVTEVVVIPGWSDRPCVTTVSRPRFDQSGSPRRRSPCPFRSHHLPKCIPRLLSVVKILPAQFGKRLREDEEGLACWHGIRHEEGRRGERGVSKLLD